MINRLKNFAKNHLINVLGWRTNRKIVVFESDDWGSIRMRSKNIYEEMLSRGYRADQCPYNRNDAIESNDDLELLFEVLDSVEDKRGNPAILTINNIVANPDFKKIKENNFEKYDYEPFTQTLEEYSGRDRVMDLYREGIQRKLFKPQFHGREHLNVNRWMEGLNTGDKLLREAFECNMYTLHKSGSINGRKSNLDAFGMAYSKEWVTMEEVIETGLDLFKSIWGSEADSFIAPCYVWPSNIEKKLSDKGINSIQGTHVQKVPREGRELKIKKLHHFQGQTNVYGQRYLVRNVFFEPAENEKIDWVSNALNEIDRAFKYNKPAIISSHRVNFMGSIRPENRDNNLKLLSSLLYKIKRKYPEIEFMSSDQLCELMNKE